MTEAKKPEEPTQAEPHHHGKPEPDLTGKTLGDFRVLRRLGQGGMGHVYLAEQVSLKRKVALKLLKAELAVNATSLLRFKAEAEAVARATHANIVQVYFIGEYEGLHYMALEYVEGRNLREFVEKKGPPELRLGLSIMLQVGNALQRASELGITHRDIKPENILLTRKGEVKVADFGLSRVFDEAGLAPNLTQSGMTLGTPLYMSPEQVEGKPVDSRTDIYSFGVTCYSMFAGQPPFKGKTPLEIAYQHVHKEPQPLSEVRPDLPRELCTLIHKMMAKKPEDRCQTGREVVREVIRCRDTQVVADATGNVTAPSLDLSGIDSPQPTQIMPVVRLKGLRRWSVELGVILALSLGLGIGWYRWQQTISETIAKPAVMTSTQREDELRHRFEDHTKPEKSKLGVRAGLQDSVDLGLFYLEENRLDDADQFFAEIVRRLPKIPAYRLLRDVGHASLLAFKNDSVDSNKEFLTLIEHLERLEKIDRGNVLALKGNPELRKKLMVGITKDDIEAYQLLWKDNPQIRAMVARALTFNQTNDPTHFPRQFELYLHPPKATTKAP